MRRAIVLVSALLAACSSPSPAEREAIDEDAARSLWPLATTFWWEYDDSASASGRTRVTLRPTHIGYADVEREEWWQKGMDDRRAAWIVRGLWNHDAYLLVEPSRLVLAVERRLGYGGVPGIVPAYVFRWDVGAWDIKSMDG